MNEQAIFDMLQSIDQRMARIEQRLFEPLAEPVTLVAPLKVVSEATYPNDVEMEKRMRAAAAGKQMQNGIMLKPDGQRSA